MFLTPRLFKTKVSQYLPALRYCSYSPHRYALRGLFLFSVHLTKKKITGDNFTTVMCPNIHYWPTAFFAYIYCLTDYFYFCFANQFVAFNFKFVAIFQRVVSGIFVIIFYTSTDKINTLERLKCFSASRLNFVKHGHDCSPFSPNNYVCSKGSFQYFPNVTALIPYRYALRGLFLFIARSRYLIFS